MMLSLHWVIYCNLLNIVKIINIKESKELTFVSKILYMHESNIILKKDYNIESTKIHLTKEKNHEIIIRYLKKIGIKNPNYYQINIFIKYLYNEFLRFINCSKYSISTLQSSAIDMGMTIEEILKIRKFILDSILNSSKLFLFGSYENLINSIEIDINENVKNNNEIIDEREIVINDLFIQKNNFLFKINKDSLISFTNNENNIIIISGE